MESKRTINPNNPFGNNYNGGLFSIDTDTPDTEEEIQYDPNADEQKILDDLKSICETGLYDQNNIMKEEVFHAIWDQFILWYQVNKRINFDEGYKFLARDIPKQRSINELYKLNKGEALYSKPILDQIIRAFKNHVSNWYQDQTALEMCLIGNGFNEDNLFTGLMYCLLGFRCIILIISLETKENDKVSPNSKLFNQFVAAFSNRNIKILSERNKLAFNIRTIDLQIKVNDNRMGVRCYQIDPQLIQELDSGFNSANIQKDIDDMNKYLENDIKLLVEYKKDGDRGLIEMCQTHIDGMKVNIGLLKKDLIAKIKEEKENQPDIVSKSKLKKMKKQRSKENKKIQEEVINPQD